MTKKKKMTHLVSRKGLDFITEKVLSFLSSKSYLVNGYSAKSQCAGFHGGTSDETDGDEKGNMHKNRHTPKTCGAESDDEDEKARTSNSQLAWLNNILDSAVNLYKRAVPPGGSQPAVKQATTRSLVDIALNLHKSTTTGMQQWSLGDLTFGLYLLSLHHASEPVDNNMKGEQVVSPCTVVELIYHVELAKGAYMKNAASLARVSMLRESNVVKFMDKSSVMRPAYYIAVDTREKLVVLGIRGTSSVHDVVTDLVSQSNEEVNFDGGNVHFGTAQAAEWFIANELDTLRCYLEKHKGFGLRVVGHSLGGATASLLAMMLRKKSEEELGFCPSLVTAVGFASPPCVSRLLALQCANFVRTVVLQDDVIPRISAASSLRLRNEILGLNWMSFLRKEAEERKGVLDLVASTMQALSSVQDVARRYTAYASVFGPSSQRGLKASLQEADCKKTNLSTVSTTQAVEELYSPGAILHIRGQPFFQEAAQKCTEGKEACTLWKVESSEFLRRIVLTGSFFMDHKCDSYYQGLRDCLKGLPKFESV